MKTILIAGGKSSGKSHIMLCLAKLMTNAGLGILAVDATKTADILNFFNINPTIKDRFSLDRLPVIMREGFDIIAPGVEYDSELLANTFEEKDIVLLESDSTPSIPEDTLSHIILIQDMNISNLYPLKDLLQQIVEQYPDIPVSFVLNNYLHCKLSIKFICHTLGVRSDQFHIIPFDPVNMLNSLNSRVDGVFKLKDFSNEHNHAVYALFCELTGIKNTRRDLKQIVNQRRKQE